MQKEKPLAYFSRALLDGNLAKLTYEKKFMALVLYDTTLVTLFVGMNIQSSHRSKSSTTSIRIIYHHTRPTKLACQTIGV